MTVTIPNRGTSKALTALCLTFKMSHVFAKSVFEPIEDGCKLDEGEEGGSEFVIASTDSAMTFDSTKEVFDAMAPTIKAASERSLASTPSSPWDAAISVLFVDEASQIVRIKALIRH